MPSTHVAEEDTALHSRNRQPVMIGTDTGPGAHEPAPSRRLRYRDILAIVLLCVLLWALIVTSTQPAGAGEIVRADGRREAATELRKSSSGRWTAQMDGRRVALKPGDVVVVIDDAGNESITLPSLSEQQPPAHVAAALGQIEDPRNKMWRPAAMLLGEEPTRSVHDALVELAGDRKKELRGRAITALTMLRTRESVAAAVRAVTGEKDTKVRRESASTLLSVREIVTRSDTGQSLRTGMKDKDKSVRVVFALLAPAEDATGIEVLRKDGLGHGDHHFRESAALELARRGDGAGEAVLIKMLRRARLPGFDAADKELHKRYLVREKIDVCALLGKLGTDAGKAALVTAGKSRFEAVRKAAAAALEHPAPGKDE